MLAKNKHRDDLNVSNLNSLLNWYQAPTIKGGKKAKKVQQWKQILARCYMIWRIGKLIWVLWAPLGIEGEGVGSNCGQLVEGIDISFSQSLPLSHYDIIMA